MTPYGQTVEDHETQRAIIDELEASCEYRARRKRIAAFNAEARSSSAALRSRR